VTARVVVVGGGILGTMHAWFAARAGHRVVHLEREPEARGASLRNFGLVWVSGRAPGVELALALRSRELWEQIGHDVPGTGFRANGSITLVDEPAQVAVLEDVVSRPDAADRGFHLVSAADVRRHNPALDGDFVAGLLCTTDAAVEPRLVPTAIRAALEPLEDYTYVENAEVVDVRREAGQLFVAAAGGRSWPADHVVVCPGAWHSGLVRTWLGDDATRALRRVRLHMMQTEPLGQELTTSVADADSLRYYPVFAGPTLDRLPAPDDAGARWAMQLLMVQRLDGGLTIGDTHLYDEPFGFDLEAEPFQLLTARAERVLGRALPPLARRWAGVYSQLVPGADLDATGELGQGIYLHRRVDDGIDLVTGPGGRGMTLSAAIAERTLIQAGLLSVPARTPL
jgi:FAD dependent oxidoreductase TIGR03364